MRNDAMRHAGAAARLARGIFLSIVTIALATGAMQHASADELAGGGTVLS